MEVSSLVAEIECEVQRADEVQDRLKQVQTTRTTTQTILGIIAGGLANILSGGIGMATRAGDAADIASVAGGDIGSPVRHVRQFYEGPAGIHPPSQSSAGIWDGEGKAREFFSPGVWRFLTEPDIRDLEGHSLRDVLVQTWNEEGRLGKPGSQQEKARKALLFGEGRSV